MTKLVDVRDLKSLGHVIMWVRVPLMVLKVYSKFFKKLGFITYVKSNKHYQNDKMD